MFEKLKENDAMKSVNNPQEYRYMRWLRYQLNFIGGWPNMESSKNTYYKLSLFFAVEMCLSITSQVVYISNNYRKVPFFTMGQNYINVLVTVVVICRCILQCLSKYEKFVKYFINNFHLYHFKNSSQYAMETHVFVHKMSHYYTLYLVVLTGSGMMLFNLTPLYNNISSGAFNNPRPENVTFEHSIYFGLPFDCYTDIRGYIPIFILNWHFSHVATASVCIFDLFLSLMILHMWGHLKILMNDLQSIPKLAKNSLVYSKEENKTIFFKLRHCIQSHNLIIDFAARMSDVYDVVIVILYLFFQVTCCLLLLQCSTLEPRAITRYGPMTLIIYQQLIQISLIFELLGSTSDKLPDAVYNMPWECMNTSNRKIVYIMLLKSQTPIQFKALNVLKVGVQTMASILKSSVSYFIMLRTIDNGN